MSIYSLVRDLNRLKERDDRGAIASLRRLLGQRSGHTRAYRYVIPHVPQDEAPANYLLVAGLFGLHPLHTGPTDKTPGTYRRNVGDVMARLRRGEDDQATERRFHRLLEAHRDQVEDYLRQVVGMAATAGGPVAIDYVQLYWDLRRWNDERRSVQLRWARAFYAGQPANQT